MLTILGLATFGASQGFANVLNAALGIADWVCVGVIMFAGARWMFGDRTAAIQWTSGTVTGAWPTPSGTISPQRRSWT